MDFASHQGSDKTSAAVTPAEAAVPVLRPEFRPMPKPTGESRPIAEPRPVTDLLPKPLCVTGPFNPGSKECQPKINLSPLSDLDQAVIDRTARSLVMPDKIKSDPILDLKDHNSTDNFRLNLNIAPRISPDIDFRQRLDRVITIDLNFNGQPAEMSLNTRKCHLNARTGLCFRMKF